MSVLLDAALDYARHGWPVFPVEPHGKQPVGRLVPHGLKDATTDETVIKRWWASEPEANIGTPTGIIFDAADFDSNAAMNRFNTIALEHHVDIKTFPRASTGRGRHVLVSPTGIGNKVDVIPGMDWRGRGGYVLLAGSIHVSGKTYEWIQHPAQGLPEAPGWLLELLTPPVAPSPPTGGSGVQAVSEAYIKAAVDGELKQLRSATAGKRNDALNRSAFALGQMVGAGWITQAQATADLYAAALSTGLDQDDGEKSVRGTIKSGLESGQQKPREAPVERTPRTGTSSTTPPIERPAPSITTAATLKTKLLTRPRAIIPGMIQVGLTMLAGKGKLGKSWLALDIALAVADDGNALSSMAVENAGEVLYLALEDNEWRMQERLQKLSHRHDFPDRLNISFEWPKLDEGGIQAIEGWLQDHPGAALVIIDVWKRLRHSRKQGAQLYDEDYEHLVPLQALAQRHGVAVLVVHHTRKSAAEDVTDEISGTGGVLAALDAWIILHRPRTEADGELWLGGRDFEEAHLALRFEGGAWALLGSAAGVIRTNERREIIQTLIAVPGGMSPAEVAEALGKSRVATKQLMWKMFMDHELTRSSSSKYAAAVNAVNGARLPENVFNGKRENEDRLPAVQSQASGKRSPEKSFTAFTGLNSASEQAAPTAEINPASLSLSLVYRLPRERAVNATPARARAGTPLPARPVDSPPA